MLSKDEIKALALKHANRDAEKPHQDRAYPYRGSSIQMRKAMAEASPERKKIDVDEVKKRRGFSLGWREKKPLLDKLGKK
jgi:hypothetical protein